MKNKRENGEVVVEASIVVTIVLILMTIMLYIGMILYQQTLISVMANQTASSISKVYSNNLKDPFTGYVDADKVYQSITYSNMKTDAYMDVLKQKASVFTQYRLKTSNVLPSGAASVDVQVVKKPNELLKSQLVVTVHDRYDVPLVGLFGVSNMVEFESTGRADCVDVLEYLNGVEAIGDPEESNVSYLPDSKNCTITFIPRRDQPDKSYSVTVFAGHSILSSNRYTHSVMPANPTDENLVFDGWEDDRHVPFTATTVVNEDMVVYGSWQCVVELIADGGTVMSAERYSFSVRKGNRASIPNATRTGYQFRGWFTERNGGGVQYLSNDSVFTGDVTLYAHWACTHPRRVEKSRTGSACTGGIISYCCSVCGADMGTSTYTGEHNGIARCGQRHTMNDHFSGVGGGCGGYHVKGQYCATCGVVHDQVYAYCCVCVNCNRAIASWCANGANHCASSVERKRVINPVNGHRYGT